MTGDDFFEESKEQSRIKSEIVKKYFSSWAKIIANNADKIVYIDLFAGQGVYDDGTKSTPILVLENALKDNLLKNKLLLFLNDANPVYVKSLENAVNSIPGIEELKFKPTIDNFRVGEDIIVKLQPYEQIPALFFVDPWGYKGLTLNLIDSVLKFWGSDCIFFFNYQRINAGLNNKMFDEHIDAIFGSQRANVLRNAINNEDPDKRENIVMHNLKEALREIRGQYVVSYKFFSTHKKRTSHFLIFVSKNILGYNIMKKIMANYSSYKNQNVATFEYYPYNDYYGLFPSTPLDDLIKDLVCQFKGKTISVGDIIDQHNVGTHYLDYNYKEALLILECENKIVTNPPAEARKIMKGKRTMSDKVLISFS